MASMLSLTRAPRSKFAKGRNGNWQNEPIFVANSTVVRSYRDLICGQHGVDPATVFPDNDNCAIANGKSGGRCARDYHGMGAVPRTDLRRPKREMAQPVIVDLHNIYRPDDMAALSFTYESIGRRRASRCSRKPAVPGNGRRTQRSVG
jgi:hypothetical protein